MSQLTEYLEQTIKPICDNYFDNHAHEFNLTNNEGCGLYTEALVSHLRSLSYVKVGHLKKNPGQTQYNGHANDAILYREGDPQLYRAIDLIGAAESTDPLNPPRKNFGIDVPRYIDKDWLAEPGNVNPVPTPNFPSYESLGGDTVARENLGKLMLADWREANRLEDAPHKPIEDRKVVIDDGFVVWTFRTLYDAFHDIIVNHKNSKQAILDSIAKHRPEWRKELGLH